MTRCELICWIFCIILPALLVIFCCYTLFGGIILIIEYEQWENSLSLETCIIRNNSLVIDCKYDCDCYDDIDGEICSICDGQTWQYTATAKSKCGDEILYEEPKSCPGIEQKELNTTHDCYVEECGVKSFSFIDNYDESQDGGIAATIISAVSICCLITCIIHVKRGGSNCCCPAVENPFAKKSEESVQ